QCHSTKSHTNPKRHERKQCRDPVDAWALDLRQSHGIPPYFTFSAKTSRQCAFARSARSIFSSNNFPTASHASLKPVIESSYPGFISQRMLLRRSLIATLRSLSSTSVMFVLLCDERFVGEALSCGPGHEAIQPLQRVTGHVAVIQ